MAQNLAQQNDINFIDETRVELNDNYHFMLGDTKPYPKIIQETRYRTRGTCMCVFARARVCVCVYVCV